MQSRFEIVLADIEDLKLDEHNARQHDEFNISEVAKALKDFGQHAPLVVQRASNTVIVGNCRLIAMERLGWTQANVLYVEDSDAEAAIRGLTDNRTAELADWDNEMLQELMSELGTEVEIPGWTQKDVEGFIALTGNDAEIPEDSKSYDEDVEGSVNMLKCPCCGYEFPE